MARINIKDVAREAGVSAPTVSRVLNPDNDHPVREQTRQRVLDAVARLKFRPNDLARGLLLKRTHTIGLLVPDMANPYYAEISGGVEDIATENEYAVIFCNSDRQTSKAERHIEVLLQKQVDGIIVAGGGADYRNISQTLTELASHVVVIGRQQLPFPAVTVDNVGGGRVATEHLLDHGHEQIGFVSGPLDSTTVQDRLAGYRFALESRGIDYVESLVAEGNFGEESGYRAGRSLLRSETRPTAIFAGNDRMAIGAMAAVADLGLRVPDDVAVVGFDNVPIASYVRPPLTTVAVPVYDLGRTAMTSLLAMIREGSIEMDEPLPTELILRESSVAAGASMGA